MSKIAIVTGVTGMTGSHMSDLLIEKDYKVYGLIRRSSNPSNNNIKHLLNNSKFELVQGDVTDASSITNLVQRLKPNELYNFAGQSQVGVSFIEPSHTFKVNAEGVINILEAIRLFSPSTRLYQASTSEMFGSSYDVRQIGQKQDDNGTTIPLIEKYQDEKTPMRPQSPYAAAKLAAHAMVNSYRNGYNLFGCCGILMNHEGVRRSPQFVTRKITSYIGKLIADTFTFEEMARNKNLLAYPKLKLGNIYAYRDWGSAIDYAKAAHLMLQQEKPDDYLVATGETRTVKDFLEEAFNLVNLKWENHVEIDASLYRPAEVDYLRGDSSKAQQKLGWKPEMSFKELVKTMVQHDIALARKGIDV